MGIKVIWGHASDCTFQVQVAITGRNIDNALLYGTKMFHGKKQHSYVVVCKVSSVASACDQRPQIVP